MIEHRGNNSFRLFLEEIVLNRKKVDLNPLNFLDFGAAQEAQSLCAILFAECVENAHFALAIQGPISIGSMEPERSGRLLAELLKPL